MTGIYERIKEMEKKKKIIANASYYMMLTAMMANTVMMVSAASSANDILQTVLGKLVAPVVIALGAVFAILGGVHWVAANSEGDGPAKQKAMMQFASGVGLVIVGTVLPAVASAISVN